MLVVDEQLGPTRPDERDRAVATLRAAGLLTEPTPELQQLCAESTLTLEEARALLDRVGGPRSASFLGNSVGRRREQLLR